MIDIQKIQIITINLNNLNGLKRTVESVLKFSRINSRLFNIFWIIKDGVSTDGSAEYLNSIKEEIHSSSINLSLNIVKDSGIFNGMNQAIDICHDGILTLFLNSGDFLSNEIINNAQIFLKSDFDIIYGDFYNSSENSKNYRKSDSNLDFEFVFSKMINHQAIFIKSDYLKKYMFKEEYWVNADWVQLFEIIKYANPSIRYIPIAISVYEAGGNSDNHYKAGLDQRELFLNSQYTFTEKRALLKIARMRQRPWYDFIIKSLDGPNRSRALNALAKMLK